MTISAIGSHISSEIKQVCATLSKKGYVNIMNDWATKADGVEIITRVALLAFSVVVTNTTQTLTAVGRVLNDAREALYALIFFRSLAQLTGMPGYEKVTKANVTSTVLLAIGAFTELVQFSLRAQIIKTNIFNKWSTQLGNYSVFSYAPCNQLLVRPSNFFLFLGSLAKSVENIYGHYTNKDSLANSLKARDVLLHIGTGGRMLLVFFNQMPLSTGNFRMLDGAVQLSDLTLYSMRA